VRPVNAPVRVAVLVGLGFLTLACAGDLAVGLAAPPDPGKLCHGGARHACFSREPAVVKSTGTNEVRVSYEDGVRSTSIDTYSDIPWARGKRVWLERWDGYIVSVSDPVTERRYRSHEWPTRWGGYSFWYPLCLLLVFGGLFVRTAYRLFVDARGRRRARRS
jgi:hypothetical protein